MSQQYYIRLSVASSTRINQECDTDEDSFHLCDFCGVVHLDPNFSICAQCLSDIFPFCEGDSAPGFEVGKSCLSLEDFDFLNIVQCRTLAHDELKNSLTSLSKSQHFTLAHFNVRSLLCNLDQLDEIIHSLDSLPSFIAITETWLRSDPSSNISLDGYKFMHTPTTFRAGGVALYYKEFFDTDIMLSYYFDFPECEQLWVRVKNILSSDQTIVIGVLYRHPKSNSIDFLEMLSSTLSIIARSSMKCIILGDLNIDLLSTSKFSLSYINNLKSYGFVPIITSPTRYSATSSTLIDHIYTNISSYSIRPFIGLYDISDHLPIFAQIFVKISQKKHPLCKRRSFLSVNYENVCYDSLNLFSSRPLPILTVDNFNECFNEFLDTVTKFVDNYAPARFLSRRERKLRKKPWISPVILKSIRAHNRMHYPMFIKGNSEQRIFYKKFSNKLNRTKKKAKEAYFRESFCRNKNQPKVTWQIINELINNKHLHSEPPSSIKDTMGNSVCGSREVANCFNRYFCELGPKLASALPPANLSIQYNNRLTPKNSFFMKPVSHSELMVVLSSLKTNKASGFDDIPSRFIKVIGPNISEHLMNFFNFCFSSGIYPDSLKIARVVPIFKSGDKSTLENYRPISILSCIAIMFEKLIQFRLTEFLEVNSLISPKQFGFRPGHDTAQAMLDVVDKYYDLIDGGDTGCSIFLDLKKAFDTVDHDILITKLYSMGIRGVGLELFKDYLSNRHQCVDISGTLSSLQPISCGVPQGSVLGPTLFLVYINSIVYASSFEITLFADDTHLFISATNTVALQQIINIEMTKIFNWLLINKLSINPNKTQILIFNQPRLTPHTLHVKLNNVMIFPSASAKYLGVMFDDKLTWKHHVEYVVGKLSRSLGILYRVNNLLPRDTLRTLYFAIFHCHLFYGISLWGFANKQDIKRIQVLQNKAVRLLAGVSLHANLNPIFVSLRILNIQKIRDFEICKFMYRFNHGQISQNFANFFIPTKSIHNYNTRFSSSLSYSIPRIHKEKCKHSLRFSGTKLWNEIPIAIRSLPFHLFKLQIFELFISA